MQHYSRVLQTKNENKHKSHLYNKTINMPRIQGIQFFFNKERNRHAECTINNKYVKNPRNSVFFNKEKSRHAECTIKQ